MKSNQKLSILFWLFKAKTSKDGRAPIYARITIDGAEEEISLGRKSLPKFWDNKVKLVTEGSIDARITNQKIGQIRADLERHFMVLQSQHLHITPAMLKNVYLGLPTMHQRNSTGNASQTATRSILAAFDNFIDTFAGKVKKNIRSQGTLRHWRSTRKKVSEYILHAYDRKDLDLNEIRYSFAESFYNYLTLEVIYPLAESTAKKHIKKTKQILGGCVNDELIISNPISSFVCGADETDIAPLELYEVDAIYRKENLVERLEEVRDAFIFQCFTGFAYQDLYGLEAGNIVKVGRNAERWLIKNRGKTGVSEMVPILPVVEEIIEKYKEHPYCKVSCKLLPVNSNARYNSYLKELATICNVARNLNTHLARHTFADIMLNSGVPLEDLSKMLGHKSIRTTQRYAKVRKPRISENMEKVRSLLFTSEGKLVKVG